MKDLQTFKKTKSVIIDKNGATTLGMDKNHHENKKLKTESIKNTDLWKNYETFIYTPTITTGISFNDKTHFHKVYVYVTKLFTDTTQTAQLTHRTRNTETNEIVVIIKNIHNTINAGTPRTPRPQARGTPRYPRPQAELPELEDLKHHKYLKNIGADAYGLFQQSQSHISTLKLITELLTTTQDKETAKKLREIKNNFISNNNTAYTHLLQFELLKEYKQYNSFLYEYILKNHEWGIHDFETKFFMKKIDSIDYKSENNHVTDMTGEDFKNSKYLTAEELEEIGGKYLNTTDDTQEYRDFMKTLLLKKYGISKTFYEKGEDDITENVFTFFKYMDEPFKK